MGELLTEAMGSLENPEIIILALMFSAVTLLVLGGAGVLASGDPLKRRLQTHVRPASTRRKDGRKTAQGIAGRLEKRKSAADPEKVSSLRRKLIKAGYSGPSAVSYFLLARILAASALPPAVLLIIPFVVHPLPEPAKMGLAAAMAAIVGFYLPLVWVDHRIGARQEEARQGFPDALDMLLVCVEAGLSLAAALNRVGKEIGEARPLLGEHFRLVALEMQAGKSREQALRNMADRIGIDECRSLVTLLLQSETLGTSIGQSLRVHAEEMRRKRLVRAEERGNKLPAKMTIPLICFILPALLSVIMTPLVIQFIRVVAPALAGR